MKNRQTINNHIVSNKILNNATTIRDLLEDVNIRTFLKIIYKKLL